MLDVTRYGGMRRFGECKERELLVVWDAFSWLVAHVVDGRMMASGCWEAERGRYHLHVMSVFGTENVRFSGTNRFGVNHCQILSPFIARRVFE